MRDKYTHKKKRTAVFSLPQNNNNYTCTTVSFLTGSSIFITFLSDKTSIGGTINGASELLEPGTATK